MAQSWDGLHPRLTRRAAWLEHKLSTDNNHRFAYQCGMTEPALALEAMPLHRRSRAQRGLLDR